VFLIFYRAAYVAIALCIGVSEYRKDGDLFEAIAFSVAIAVALEVLYWLQGLQTRTPPIVLGWIKARERRKNQEKPASGKPGGWRCCSHGNDLKPGADRAEADKAVSGS
jgi:hypothetical protein